MGEPIFLEAHEESCTHYQESGRQQNFEVCLKPNDVLRQKLIQKKSYMVLTEITILYIGIQQIRCSLIMIQPLPIFLNNRFL